jgi:hypothetical protein
MKYYIPHKKIHLITHRYPERTNNQTYHSLINARHKSRVHTSIGIIESFETKKLLKQRDALLCLAFNLALEVIRKTSLDIRGTKLHNSLQILAYLDDSVYWYT